MTGLRTVAQPRTPTSSRGSSIPTAAREAGLRARAAVAASAFSSGIGEALDAFFSESRQQLARAIEVIREAQRDDGAR